MNGVLCVDKPEDYTSFDVVARLRGILKQKKIGHGGTLDPMATGVLPIFLGQATRCIDILPVTSKRYLASAKLGILTDTEDITGRLLKTEPFSADIESVRAVAESFLGSYMQVPPMYSAIKQNGRRLYAIAREGGEVLREAREVFIESIEVTGFNEQSGEFWLDISCSKGTYIRTLCMDIGNALGTVATMTSLRRTEACSLTLEGAVSLEDLERLMGEGSIQSAIIPVERMFSALPRAYLKSRESTLIKNGVRLHISRAISEAKEGRIALFEDNGAFIGVGEIDRESGNIINLKQLWER